MFSTLAINEPKATGERTTDVKNTISMYSSNSEEVILAAAIVLITDAQGAAYSCRALLDSGSQSNFNSQSLALALGLKQSRTATTVTGIGNTEMPAKFSVHTKIKSRFNNYEENLNMLILKKIVSDLPVSSITTSLNNPSNLELADEKYFLSRRIDITSIFYDIMQDGQLQLGKSCLLYTSRCV